MKIVVTCGPSHEPIDEARRLTNFSTGRLGITLASALQNKGHEVFCFKGEMASHPHPETLSITRFSTNNDLSQKLEKLGREEPIDIVFHAAALCDFKPARVVDGDGSTVVGRKVPTRDGELSLVLTPTIKVLPQLRGFFSRARIVGWKYELDGARQEAFSKARRQIAEARADACVLNGAAYGNGFAICEPGDRSAHCDDLDALIRALVAFIERDETPA
jgi:phosphopantothenoylcysteine synthetase/decarboxylase